MAKYITYTVSGFVSLQCVINAKQGTKPQPAHSISSTYSNSTNKIMMLKCPYMATSYTAYTFIVRLHIPQNNQTNYTLCNKAY